MGKKNKKTEVEMKILDEQEFQEKYQQKADYLKKQITDYESGNNKIIVFNHEAGFGKSLITNEILASEVKHKVGWDETPRKYLLVKKFKKDVLESN